MKTYGIKYAGSKLRIIPYITAIVSELEDVKKVLDVLKKSRLDRH